MDQNEFFRLLIQRLIARSSPLYGQIFGLSESWDFDYGDYYHQGLKVFFRECQLWVTASYDGEKIAIFDNTQPVPAYSTMGLLAVVVEQTIDAESHLEVTVQKLVEVYRDRSK